MQDDQGVLSQSPSEGSGEWSYPEEEWTFVIKVPPPEDPETPTPTSVATSVAPTHDRTKTMSPVEIDGVHLQMRIDNDNPNEVKMSLTDLPPLPAPIPEPTTVAETPRTTARRVDREESDRVWDAYVATQKEQAALEEAKAKAAAAAKADAEKSAAAAALGFGTPAAATPRTAAPVAAGTPVSPTTAAIRQQQQDAAALVEAEVVRARREVAEREAIERQKRDSEAGALASALLAAQAEIDSKQREEAIRRVKREEKRQLRAQRREQRQREKEERRVWELAEMGRRNRYLHRSPIDFVGSSLKNLCPLPRSLYSLNLDPLGDHPLVDEGVVFVLSRFSRGFRTTDLMDAFGNDVRPTIRWIDDYSAFAIVKEKEKADAAFEYVKRSELMTIQTLEQFQAQRAAMMMEPLLRLATSPIGAGFIGDQGMDGYTNRSRARTLAKSPQYPSHFPGSPSDKSRMSRTGTAHDLNKPLFDETTNGDDVHIDIGATTDGMHHPLINKDDEEYKDKPFKIGLWAMLFILLGVGIFAAGVGWTIGKSGRT